MPSAQPTPAAPRPTRKKAPAPAADPREALDTGPVIAAARRARDWVLHESPLRDAPFLRDARVRAMALERARLAQVPRELRGLGLHGFSSLLRGRLDAPPGARLAPSPPSLPIVGNLAALSSGPDRLRALLQLRAEHGDVVRLQFGGLPAHLVSDPDLVGEVLHTRNKVFGKHTRGLHKLRLVLGMGLLTSEGSFWLRQRRIAQPAFHRKRIAGFADRMVQASEDMVGGWEDGAEIDAHHEMMKVTLRIVSETLLGADTRDDAEAVGAAVAHIVEDVNQRVDRLIDVPPIIPTRRNRAFTRSMDTLDRIVLDMIEERRASGERRDDLLSMFMEVRDAETGEAMSDAQLRDEIMTIFLAGHETTANALSWSLYLLGQSPTVARKLRAEVLEVLPEGRPATMEDVPKLTYTKQVLQEAMRLYPPAWMVARAPNEDTELGGYFLPESSLVFVSPWVVHRHPDHWEDPEGFDPERFAPERAKGRHKYAYFPFGGGPRICIGNGFAMMEAQLVLATIVRDWHLDLVPGFPVEAEPVVTLRPKHGLRVRLRRAR
ncbi:MAG TPA: cytochrome P450 [Polyangiaceae bacterium LLY-WYZ-15_(1-7)]|nr:cytochrome P450 [Myxococcales bacterium]MAT24513.1 cytochrome P450 [Sandaracinus sp.]HJL01714.1 cytochrome P450 [Polyangiaceae bacterium LLY-WYZ-15_(1-7)]HJL09888.1 cytochrome P450 [Polyangiaceae bacterium LLY-WYZ-15_(1-7)]HJL37877.1 cytochrome P450 [Polyangiaceae bacterium LLY-WYZ-15_(1-7)]